MPFTFFIFFFPSIRKIYIFTLCPTNLVIMASLFSSFIKPGIFLFVSGISYVLDSVIVRIKSTYNTFHDIVNIVTFYVIYEAISIDIHNFGFFAKQRCHVLVVKFVQTRLGYVEYAHTHVYEFIELHLKFMHFYLTRFFEKTLRLWKFDFAIIILASTIICLPFC